MIHMFSICLSLLLMVSVNIIIASNLRCNEDINGSFQVIENCRACVIFIAPATLTSTSTTTTTTTTTTTVLPRHFFASNAEPSIEELFLFDEKKRRRRRRRQTLDTVIHQQCAREFDGPLYGYDQTHCYCNSNQCNSNIQRCIYEVTSKRHFACYHGSNSSQYPLEIRHKCRSCRIRTEFNSIYYYECLTFGEREQNNQTHCTCQRPMCNQDVSTCHRSQQQPSQPRAHSVHGILINSTILSTITTMESTSTSTIETTTITTTIISTTTTTATSLPSTTPIPTTTTNTTPLITSENIVMTLSTIIENAEEISTENATLIELTTINDTTTSYIEIKHLKTVYIEVKNHGNSFSLTFTLFQSFLFLFIYSM